MLALRPTKLTKTCQLQGDCLQTAYRGANISGPTMGLRSLDPVESATMGLIDFQKRTAKFRQKP